MCVKLGPLQTHENTDMFESFLFSPFSFKLTIWLYTLYNSAGSFDLFVISENKIDKPMVYYSPELMRQSIPAAPIPPRATAGHLHTLSVPGSGISQPQGYPRAFDTTWFPTRDPNVDNFVGKDRQFVTDWLVRQGLDKIVEVFKGMFP